MPIVCVKPNSRFLVPDDGTDFQAVLTVAVGANDGFGIFFLGIVAALAAQPIQPAVRVSNQADRPLPPGVQALPIGINSASEESAPVISADFPERSNILFPALFILPSH